MKKVIVLLITICSYGLLFSYSIVEFLNLNRFTKLGIDGLITSAELVGIGYVIMRVLGENNISNYKLRRYY